MNNRERVLMSLRHEQPDRIPYNINFTQKAHAKIVEFYGDPGFAAKLGNCLTNISSEPENSWNEISADIWEDQFGVRRLLDGIGENGGYIAAPAHAIPPDAKPENIAAMIEVLQDQ